jgi:ATP-dependent DNA helicase RecG
LIYKRAVSVASPSLSARLHDLHGVVGERKAQLERLGLRTLEDLLLHRPRRHEDRRHFKQIRELELGEPATIRGEIVALGLKRFKKSLKSIFEIIIEDGSARLHCRWWNMPFMERYFERGDNVFVYGKPNNLRPRTMDHPETEVVEPGEDSSIHINRIVPIYPLTEGLPQRWLRGFIWRAVEQFAGKIEEPWPEGTLPGRISRQQAVRNLHFPEDLAQARQARERLALDEFIHLQLEIQRRRKAMQAHAKGLPAGGDNRLIKPFLHQLSFTLTPAQTRVLREIRLDLAGKYPMRRLLQGDVGSGKTVVAAASALMAIESGYSVALMAPTEILAEQHYQNFRNWFDPLGVRVEMQTGSRKTIGNKTEAASRQPELISTGRPANGTLPLFIGTHALIEGSFELQKLGLVIIDEQHKFGVSQREKLVRKGHYPHVLVMTATPIPRTLGLTLYGDLDISIIDKLPAQRGRIKTFLRTPDKLPKVWDFIREKIVEGRQAYVVYPRVEDSGPAGNVKAVTREHARLEQLLSPYKVGLLHGRLRSEEKEAIMTRFRNREIQLLVATSIIEVGVDVPNATVMLIENAEQFGLAQLHQLRGRIGRGAHDSYCILVAEPKNKESVERLRVLEETTDGFRIADADLLLRGPGELLGFEQSGLPPFRFGDLKTDLSLVEYARSAARQLMEGGASADRPPVK